MQNADADTMVNELAAASIILSVTTTPSRKRLLREEISFPRQSLHAQKTTEMKEF